MANLYGPRIVTDGLVLHLDAGNRKSYAEGSSVWNDLKNKASGTLTNGPTFSSNDGGYIVFDGSNDYIRFLSSNNFNFGTGDFTIEVYARLGALGTNSPFIQNDAIGVSQNTKWWFAYTASTLRLGRHFTSEGGYCSWTPTLNQWYHLVGTRVSGTVYLYINGVSQSVTNSTSLNGDNFTENGLAIGGISTPYYLNGGISIVRLYKGIGLNNSQVLQNFYATRERFGL